MLSLIIGLCHVFCVTLNCAILWFALLCTATHSDYSSKIFSHRIVLGHLCGGERSRPGGGALPAALTLTAAHGGCQAASVTSGILTVILSVILTSDTLCCPQTPGGTVASLCIPSGETPPSPTTMIRSLIILKLILQNVQSISPTNI